MAARLEHKRVSVSSLCIAAAVPATTALRWIKSMTDEGLFVRRADNNDGRRIFIELSDKAAGAMSAYLDWLKVNPAAMVCPQGSAGHAERDRYTHQQPHSANDPQNRPDRPFLPFAPPS